MRIVDLKPREAITVTPSESLIEAAKHLADDDVGALIVFSSSGAIGVFSERDLARAIADEVDVSQAQVGDYMTESPITVDLSSGLGDAIAKMNEFGVRHVVVTDENDVVGMVSMRDLVALLGTVWPEL
jgi:signal-transduction protein with cAMP-binding, CBS, and nucleotidyltransferase domain